MARIQSQGIAGYYATPDSVVDTVVTYLDVNRETHTNFLDPCAGEGKAIVRLCRGLYGTEKLGRLERGPRVFAVEMEQTRHENLGHALNRAFGWQRDSILHGDAFNVTWSGGVELLWLNPPYDHDAIRKMRLEDRFLQRYTASLVDRGILVYIVPGYTLKASAEYIATHYDTISVYRFAGDEYNAYKQVVVFAHKRETPYLVPDPSVIENLSRDPSQWDELSDQVTPAYTIPHAPISSYTWSGKVTYSYNQGGLSSFKVNTVDIEWLRQNVKPWHTSERGKLVAMTRYLPDPTVDNLQRDFPMASPPKPGHIAAGIAAGVFNGEKITADDPHAGYPDLLVKGVFHREFELEEEKTNADGDKTAEIQVQAPKLVLTVLNLRDGKISTLLSSVDVTGSKDPSSMTTGDLLTAYGTSLLAVLRSHCPVLYNPGDPSHHFDLPTTKRTPFKAQAHAARALVNLLGGNGVPLSRRAGLAAVLMGQIGSGKTTVATLVFLATGAKRCLTMVPPHLVAEWQSEIEKITGGSVDVMVVETIDDIRFLQSYTGDKPIVGLLKREDAKLGHSAASVEPLTPKVFACPRCGAGLKHGHDYAESRERCEHDAFQSRGYYADAAVRLAFKVLRIDHVNHDARTVLGVRGRFLARWAKGETERLGKLDASERNRMATDYSRALQTHPMVREILERVASDALDSSSSRWVNTLALLLAAINDDDVSIEIIRRMFLATTFAEHDYTASSMRKTFRPLLHVISPGEKFDALYAELDDAFKMFYDTYSNRWKHREEHLYQSPLNCDNGAVTYTQRNLPAGHPDLWPVVLSNIVEMGSWSRTGVCGERLYAAAPRPRRYPLATYISRYARDAFDFLIIDESHEYATRGSAQERAAGRLMDLGKPTLALTGSLMNGYAKSLFSLYWALFPWFRGEFKYQQQGLFVTRYGYRRIQIKETDPDTGKVVAWGSQSDRVIRRETVLGDAPGVLPLFVLKMLRSSVVLHTGDLEVDLPTRADTLRLVEPTEELKSSHTRLIEALVKQIRADRFKPDLAGKLYGEMSEAPSHLDRASADVGNRDDGSYVVAYPESVGAMEVHAEHPVVGADGVLPKEQELIDIVRAEKTEGRPCLIPVYHVDLHERIARILKAQGFKVAVLNSTKVNPAKRREWIQKNAVDKRVDVMIGNPTAFQTGLNNLVYFPTQIWLENPACKPQVFRQTCGRSHRLGQDREVRIYFLCYNMRSQEKGYRLLMHKTAVSESVDGFDASSAFSLAGVGERTSITSASVGKELYRMLAESWN